MQVKPIQVFTLTKNLKHQVSLSLNEENVILDVFLGDHIRIQKSFQNTTHGNQRLLFARNKFNTENKVKKYLKL